MPTIDVMLPQDADVKACPEPLLFSLREQPVAVSGTTTVSSIGSTSPVRESGPDD